MRQGITNCGHCEIPLVLYYLSQEIDFDCWFDVQIAFKLTSYSNGVRKRILHNACSYALLLIK